ncbi:MAG: hypothetical protein KKF33_20405 [Alphaproteobacteria bacterium]|nr:hypothetical protein [Alphaproteobacteria bacterium]
MSNPNPSPKTRFKKGESGNPEGRAKGKFSLTSLIIKQLDANPEQTEEIITWLLANRKDLVWTMIDPKPPTDLNLGSNPELPFKIVIEKDDKDKGTKS